jgi:hypothetical protein
MHKKLGRSIARRNQGYRSIVAGSVCVGVGGGWGGIEGGRDRGGVCNWVSIQIQRWSGDGEYVRDMRGEKNRITTDACAQSSTGR